MQDGLDGEDEGFDGTREAVGEKKERTGVGRSRRMTSEKKERDRRLRWRVKNNEQSENEGSDGVVTRRRGEADGFSCELRR